MGEEAERFIVPGDEGLIYVHALLWSVHRHPYRHPTVRIYVGERSGK